MGKGTYLKYQYPLAQFLYWVSCCACSGFVAIYLQYQGLSNTVIGVFVGCYGVLSLVLQPLNAKMIQIIPGLTVRKLILILVAVMTLCFLLMVASFIPGIGAICLFAFANALNSSMVPLLSTFGMEYVNRKREVNFGLARGFGSLGWAVSAVVIGFLVEFFSPQVLSYVYVASATILMITVWSMEEVSTEIVVKEDPENSAVCHSKEGVLRRCLSDATFMFVAFGIFLGVISHALCTTYTINVVEHVGGSESAVGLAQFFGAASEMIGMVIFGRLIKKYSCLKILKISMLFLSLRFFFLIFATNLPMVMLGYAIQGPSAGLYIPATVYFVNERMLPEHRTQGQTIFNIMTNSMAAFVGNLLGGRLLDLFGLKTTLIACFVFAAVGCACVMTRRESEGEIR